MMPHDSMSRKRFVKDFYLMLATVDVMYSAYYTSWSRALGLFLIQGEGNSSKQYSKSANKLGENTLKY